MKSVSLFDPEIPLERVWRGPNTTMTLPMVPPGVGGILQEVQEVIKHLLEPVKLSEIDTSYCMMFPGVFSSKITLDWVWKGPNTTRTLSMVPPGVGGSLQVCRSSIEARSLSPKCPK